MTWFDDMAAAMRTRETALNGVLRWQAKLTAAEETIAKLGAQAPAQDALGYAAPVAAAPTQEPAQQPASEPAPAAEELPAA